MPFDFASVTAPFRMQPGLRRLADGAAQLTPNRLGDRALAEKLAVLSAHPAQALLVAPGFDPAAALHALADHAVAEQPDAFARAGETHWRARHLGWSLQDDVPVGDGPAEIGACLNTLAPQWRAAALLSLAFAEDFAVIDGANATIPWLAVCLPSHWAPEDKVGRHFAQVHAPVADNQVLITASEQLARLVTRADRWERFVWTITRHPQLSRHPLRSTGVPWPADAQIDAFASRVFFRSERQTFIPVPDHTLAIFTIHVETQPLVDAIVLPDHARLVHDALASMSPAVLDYRGLADARDRLLAWLAVRAGR